jgi:hypothetical protein
MKNAYGYLTPANITVVGARRRHRQVFNVEYVTAKDKHNADAKHSLESLFCRLTKT